MNLNRLPTEIELKKLLASCDDHSGNHVLWVNHDGDVQISLIPSGQSIVKWDRKHYDEILFRLGAYHAGGGWVGSDAASDNKWVADLFSNLIGLWHDYCEPDNT